MQRLLLAFIAMLCLSTIASAQSADMMAEFVERGNMRSGGGVDWSVIGTYPAGTPIRLDGQAFEGAWVRGIVPDGTVGWVYTAALNISQEQAATLRGIWVDDAFNLPAPEGGPSPASDPADEPPPEQPASSAPPASAASGPIQTRTSNQVNMRVNPGQDIIRTLAYDEAVTVDGKHPNNEWVRVTTADGARGWIYYSYATLTVDEFANLPVVEGGATGPQNAPAPEQPANDNSNEAAAPVANTAPVRGFNYGGHIAHMSQQTVNALNRAGMTWVKRQWRYQRGQNPDDTVGLINEAHASGFNILLGIVGHPNELNQPGYIEEYANFVGGVAARGANAIEVWNEPNIDREWPSGSIGPANYVNLLRPAYNAIKAANPNTLVISGAPAPTGFFGGCSGGGCDDDAFVRGMAAAGAASYMDCIGIHYNEGIISPDATSGDPRGNSGHYTRYFWGMVNTYSRAFGGSRPLCFTELGYLTPDGFPPLPGGFAWAQDVTLAQHAAWLDRAVSLAAGSGRVRLLIVWNIDYTEYGSDPMAGYAMIRPDGSCPACDALGQ